MRGVLDGEHDRKSVLAGFITALQTDEVQLQRELLAASKTSRRTYATSRLRPPSPRPAVDRLTIATWPNTTSIPEPPRRIEVARHPPECRRGTTVDDCYIAQA
jgi:hypothetical protein